MQHLHHVDTLDEMRLVANEIVLHIHQYPVVLLKGNLGAGKTTLAQMIAQLLGINESVTSPTYTLVNEYDLKDHHKMYHFDLYRLQNEEELEGIGFTEYLDSGNICLIEWPEVASNYLNPLSYMQVNIHKNDETREIEIEYHTITA